MSYIVSYYLVLSVGLFTGHTTDYLCASATGTLNCNLNVHELYSCGFELCALASIDVRIR